MRDTDWFIPMVVIVGIQFLLWVSLASSGLAPWPLFGISGLLAYTFMALVTLGQYLRVLYQMRRAGEKAPLARSIELLRGNWTRIVIAIVAIQVLSFQSALSGALKAAIPAVNPFWLDSYLVKLDGALFGDQPWKLIHAAPDWFVPFIDAAYEAWLFVQIVAILSVLLFKPSKLKGQAILSFVMAWFVMGVIAAGALSSAGPIYFDRLFGGNTFTGLPLINAPGTAKVSAILWSSYQSGHLEIGSGISAMPSMHVAITLWFALAFRKTVLAPLAWAYVPIIWIGSVVLGWHYFSDGLVGIIGMVLIWLCAPRLIKLSSAWLGPKDETVPVGAAALRPRSPG